MRYLNMLICFIYDAEYNNYFTSSHMRMAKLNDVPVRYYPDSPSESGK